VNKYDRFLKIWKLF